MSQLLWGCNQELGVALNEEITIVDYGDFSPNALDINATRQNNTSEVCSILEKK